MTAGRISIVVLAWNRWDLTEACIRSLQRTLAPGSADILVVDNGSTDETPRRLREVGWVRVLRLEENLGFVRGNNAGIRACPRENDVVLLNNDVELLELGWLERLADTAAEPETGLVGCRLLARPGILGNAGAWILPDTCWGEGFGSFETDLGQFGGVREVPVLQFACVLVPRRTLDAVGLLSERYRSYFEDADYCLRVREHGLKVLCRGDVSVVHHHHGSTQHDPELRKAIFEESRSVFRAVWQDRLESRYGPSLHWQSVLGFSMGYATAGRGLVRELDQQGVRVSYSYLYGEGTPYPADEPKDLGDPYLNVLAARSPHRPCVSVAFGIGNAFYRSEGEYRVGFSMLEVDGLPQEWVRQANEMDEVWVPSTFNRETFATAGIRRPIRVMPLGVDLDYFTPRGASMRDPRGRFVFLTVFEWNERKAPRLLLESFSRAFRSSDPVLLVCKIISTDPAVDVRAEIARMELRPQGGRIRVLLNGEIPYAELPALYRSADCYVAASHGEGWNMPLVEAMACGLPAIATDWSSHRDLVSDLTGYPLPIRGLVPAHGNPYHVGFRWAEPDSDHLVELMRHVATNPKEAQGKGSAAAREVTLRWSLPAAASGIRDRLTQIAATGTDQSP